MNTYKLLSCATVILSSSAINAATIIGDFTQDFNAGGNPNVRAAAFDPVGSSLSNPNVPGGWVQTSTPLSSFTFRTGLTGLGAANELVVTVNATATTTGTRDIFSAAGNGIAVHGGTNNNWFEVGDNAILNFAVSI